MRKSERTRIAFVRNAWWMKMVGCELAVSEMHHESFDMMARRPERGVDSRGGEKCSSFYYFFFFFFHFFRLFSFSFSHMHTLFPRQNQCKGGPE